MAGEKSWWQGVKDWSWSTRYDITHSKTLETLGKGTKKAGLIALAAGAIVATPFIINSMRSNRRFKPEDAPLPPELIDPTPQVMMAPPQQTLMGMQPVEGAMAQRVLASRGGAAAGVDPSNPGLMDIDGSGQMPQALGR